MLQLFDDLDQLSRYAAAMFAQRAAQAVTARGRFVVALSGGHTPSRTFQLLALPPYRARVPWSRIHVFWGDERCVPTDDERNNARLARLALLGHVPVPAGQIHAIPTEIPADEAAVQYETLLREFFADAPPRFDMTMLGLGSNGHTASLFPGAPTLNERDRWVAAVHTESQSPDRVTLTVPLINRAALVVFLVAGETKASALKHALSATSDSHEWPARLVQPQGDLYWLVDREAARLLGEPTLHIDEKG